MALLIDAARAGSSSALGELLEGYRQHLLLVANRTLSADLRASMHDRIAMSVFAFTPIFGPDNWLRAT